MNKKTILAVTLAVGAGLALAASASAQVEIASVKKTKIYLTVDTVGTVQALDQKNVVEAAGTKLPGLEPGFQTAWGNLGVLATFGDEKEIEMFFDLFISSRNHPSTTYGHQGYLLMRGAPGKLKEIKPLVSLFQNIDLKVGHFHIDYGDHRLHGSDNALVFANPLIGNFVVDPEIVDIGAEVQSKPGKFNWLFGVSNGTNTEDFRKDRGTALHAKVWLDAKPLRVALSAFNVDHSKSVASRNTLFAGNRDGERYGGVFGGAQGQAPGQILPAAGKKVTAWQADVTYTAGDFEFYGNYGDTKDADTNGPLPGKPVEEWIYYAGQIVYGVTPEIYVASRYSAGRPDSLAGRTSNGTVDRIQFGGGYKVTENMLVKLELVKEQYSGFKTGEIVGGLRAVEEPEFSGGLMEFAFRF